MVRVHLLDVGAAEYGDSVLCRVGSKRVLIDGAHPGDQDGSPGHRSIPEQLSELLHDPEPIRIDLLVVTHAHSDHIGCLPNLVQNGVIEVDWALVADPELGWGRHGGGHDAPPADARVARLAAGLREEVLSDRSSAATVDRFLADAVTLEGAYKAMLAKLEADGTHVVRYGRDPADDLLDAFASTGLEILGPSKKQLQICADEIARRTQRTVDRITDTLHTDADASDADLYRMLLHSPTDAVDAQDRPGPAINLQSAVTSFRRGGATMLFAGDMQFADAQVGAEGLQAELDALRATIAAKAPFGVVKLSHHGSDNGFDEDVLAELGATSMFGICAGEKSSAHPNPAVLELLDAHRDELDWVRTDRNGLATVEFNGARKISVTTGSKDDPRPNTSDIQVGGRPATTVQLGGAGSESVEVTVKVTIDVERRPVRAPAAQPLADRAVDLRVGGGRALPPLLFVTNRDALAANVGLDATEAALAAIRAVPNARLYDELPRDAVTSGSFAVEGLAAFPEAEGVVLVGGPNVVPPQRRDCLQPDLRARLEASDLDDFIVWSDAPYGRRSERPTSDLPVSRVPDGYSADLLFAALGADDAPRGPARQGLRNIARPFADGVYDILPGDQPLPRSKETTFDSPPELSGDHLYLMLHGAYQDGTRFWGEETPRDAEALNLTNIRQPAARVVFTGCCWGALTADQPAVQALPGEVPAAKPAGSSIALEFLQRGSTAFIGCTGAHYSPQDPPPYDYFGGPMHEAFWTRLLEGLRPASALFQAKIDYLAGFPHGRRTAWQVAVEYKILNQYTCLGLGW